MDTVNDWISNLPESELTRGFDTGLEMNNETLSYFLLMVAAMSLAKVFNKVFMKKARKDNNEHDVDEHRRGFGSRAKSFFKHLDPRKAKDSKTADDHGSESSEPTNTEQSESENNGMLDKLFGTKDAEKEHDHDEHKHKGLMERVFGTKDEDTESQDIVEVPTNNTDHHSRVKAHSVKNRKKSRKHH